MSERIIKYLMVGIFALQLFTVTAQLPTVQGKVIESKTGAPLVDAVVRLRSGRATVTNRLGEFQIAVTEIDNDSISVSFLGFATITLSLREFRDQPKVISMVERAYELREVVVIGTALKRKAKQHEASMRLVKDKLFAGHTEVTNAAFNDFLIDLQQSNQEQLYQEYRPNYKHGEATLAYFFKGYHVLLTKSDSALSRGYDKYPVVNITQKAATAYCEWLTSVYNAAPKRKYNTVRFRLPTLQEWSIAALGYKEFQSWELDENIVEVRIPDNDVDEVGKRKSMIPVKGNDILYPWYGSYNYRNKAQNRRNCWMGNFSVPLEGITCVVNRPGGDGYEITAPVATFFSNGMGLYDVVGNVAEMIDKAGIACGGSWNHSPSQSTIRSKCTFTGRDPAVGFRVFMEIVKP